MIDLRQSPNYSSYMKMIGWEVDEISSTDSGKNIYIYTKRLPFLPFSVMKVQRFSAIPNIEQLQYLIKAHHVFFITLEPGVLTTSENSASTFTISSIKFKLSNQPFLPSKTIQIDLKPNIGSLFAQIKKDARASVKRADKICEVKVFMGHSMDTLEHFYSFFQAHGKGYIPRKHDFFSMVRAFEKNCFVVSVVYNKQIISGTVILMSDHCAYYYFAVSSELGRKLGAGYYAVFYAMREAKKRNCLYFDLEGIYDERFPTFSRWKGFSMFKKKFGGSEIVYPGAFHRFLLPI